MFDMVLNTSLLTKLLFTTILPCLIVVGSTIINFEHEVSQMNSWELLQDV